MEEEWQKIWVSATIKGCRGGWGGVWDAFVAALLRRPVFSFPLPVRYSVWVKVPPGCKAAVMIAQGEIEFEPGAAEK